MAKEIADLKDQRGNTQDAIEVLKQSMDDLSESEDVSKGFVAKAQKELDVIDAEIATLQKDKMSVEEAVERLRQMKAMNLKRN